MPGTSSVVTNIRDEPALIDRFEHAVVREIDRRRQLIEDSGFRTLRDYRQARRGGAELGDIATLLVVVNEFPAFAEARRGFADFLTRILRTGRRVGVKLLLVASRLPADAIDLLHAIDDELTYRVALRVQSTEELGAALQVSDPPAMPSAGAIGSGYFRTVRRAPVPFATAQFTAVDEVIRQLAGHGTPAASLF